jgi:molecular chaperone Hsp33
VVRPRGEPQTSVIEVTGFDVLEIFEQYYDRSEQNPARFYPLEGERFAAVLGLPGVNREWLAALTTEEAVAILEASPVIEERTFRFECGCTHARILEVMQSIFGQKPEELFHEDPRVEVFCPRCGRRWWVDRGQFDANG